MTHDHTAWLKKAKAQLDWFKTPTQSLTGSFEAGNIQWFEDGILNVCYNCIDRHLPEHANKTAIIWEGDEPDERLTITFQTLYEKVCQFANVLKSQGIGKGDRVAIYLPMIPEATYAMLACARIGAIHSVVFGGFSPESLKARILDSACKMVITISQAKRGGKSIPFLANTDVAVADCECVSSVLVIDENYPALESQVSGNCPAEPMSAEDPLFILYTSGSTGKPKGVVHTSAGYLLYASDTLTSVFQLQPDDVYWCTADIGWITGHSYIVYGPLANATTTLMFGSTPEYPSIQRYWEVVDRYQVSVFYTAPTAIRALMAQGKQSLENTLRASLRVLGSVGEPINPEAWQWYFTEVGQARCPIMDTWWQTETGGFMLAPPFDKTQQKPGAAMQACAGIYPALLDANAEKITGPGEGALVIQYPWPGMMRTLYGDHDRYIATYFTPYPGYYFTGDGTRRDEDGDLWIAGRLDDVLNVAGHRLGTAEIESALVAHPDVAEAAIVGIPNDIKGQAIYAFITVTPNTTPDENLAQALRQQVRTMIGPVAHLNIIQWADAMPKTRSGKIMRRLLRKIATGDVENLGDISTLANPSCIEALITSRSTS